MGVLTLPLSTEKWKPEDDLILKNAVEGGASLESLAKGAVQFSRKFTLRELQERWYSVLYDLKTADKVSAVIIELENEHSAPSHSKASRLSIWKGKDFSSGKRKADSIRSHYYAMRKRISVEPCTVNQVAPAAPFSFRNSNGYGCHYEYNFQDQNPGDDGCLAQHLLDPCEDQEVSYDDDIMRFSTHGNVDNSHHVFLPHFLDSVNGTHRDDTMCHDYQNGYAENTSLQLADGAGLDTFDNECMGKGHSEFPEKINPTGNLPTDNELCNIKILEEKSSTSPGSNNDNTCNFVEETNGSLQVGLADSLHQLDCPSSAATLSLWEADNPAETMLMDLEIENKFPFRVQGDINTDALAYEEQPDAGSNDHVISSESSLLGFSTPCLDFADEEELFYLDVDDKDLVGTSCLHGLSSILMSSPCSSNPDDIEKFGQSKLEDKAPQFNLDECSERTIKSCSQETIKHEENVPSDSPKLSEMFLNCVLSMEDPEIPDNNDVSFPSQCQMPAPANVSSSDRKFPLRDSPMVNEEEAAYKQISPVKAKSSSSKNISESYNGHPASEAFRDSGTAGNEPKLPISQAAALLSGPDVMIPNLEKHAFHSTSMSLQQDTPSVLLHHVKLQPQGCTNGHRKEISVPNGQQKYVEQDTVAPGSTSDQEEQVSDFEYDIPSFADVEAMILDMDLDPDQESCFFTMEASRCQSIHSKKTIVRLEQGARAFIHRAFLSHGAFAVLYGRHLKYFIRNPEVLLGRATDDSKVDIDLSKEGRACKVSRHQAFINMDEDGIFILKNIGKHSMYVNSIEVPSKKRINLHSGSLIEIWGLRFIFEVNQSAVRRYIAIKSGQGTIEEFEWKPI